MALELTAQILRHKVSILRPVFTRNAEGEKEVTYIVAVATWAGVEHTNQYRAIEAGTPALIGAKFFYIRNRIGLNVSKDHLIRYAGADWTIQSIVEVQIGWLKILANNKNG